MDRRKQQFSLWYLLGVITEKRSILDALARLLLKQEVVERAMLDELLNTPGVAPVPSVPASLTMAVASSFWLIERAAVGTHV